LAERPGNSLAHSGVVVSQNADKGLDGTRVTDTAESPGSTLAHFMVRISQSGDKVLDGPRVTDTAECPGRRIAVMVLEHGDERLDGT
jgi:hypothetical protein